jgi:aspartyl-tRNA(Asn)/glutamyl-tRNA(Gln) amidotransferase subunit B
MRSKEQAHDYRYFPEPDLLPLVIDRSWVEDLRQQQPELPDARQERFIRDYGIPAYDAKVLTNSRALADYFDHCCQLYPNPKAVSNWIMGELLRLLNAEGLGINESKVTAPLLAELLTLMDKGTISGKIAKTVLEEMFKTGQAPELIVKEKGLVQITDESALVEQIEQVIAANPQVVSDFKNGKEKAFGFLVGQVMKQTRGKANPDAVNRLLKERL